MRWLPVALVFALGCRFSTSGANMALDFQAVVDDQVAGTWPVLAIAPGTAVTLRVLAHDELTTRLVTDWTVDDPHVVRVERDGEDLLRVVANAPGRTTLRIRSGLVEDTIVLDVIAPVAFEVLPPLGASGREPEALLAIAGQPGELPIFHLGPRREPIFALGAPPAVQLEPESVARVEPPGPRAGSRLHLTFERPGKLVITGGGGPALTIDVVAQDDISALFAERPRGGNSDRSIAAYLVRAVGAGPKALLVTGGFAVEILTPDRCAIADGPLALETKRLYGLGAFAVKSITEGTCEGEVRLGPHHDRFAVDLASPPSLGEGGRGGERAAPPSSSTSTVPVPTRG